MKSSSKGLRALSLPRPHISDYLLKFSIIYLFNRCTISVCSLLPLQNISSMKVAAPIYNWGSQAAGNCSLKCWSQKNVATLGKKGRE